MKILEKEIWKDIPNYEGLYQASNLGRVKSLERFDDLGRKRKEKILKQQLCCRYYQVHLHKNSIGKMCLVHRLVFEAFNGRIPEGYEINHLDERPVNNRLENLSLVTRKENINYGSRNERAAKKLSKVVLQFDLNDNFVKEYASVHQVERELGFTFQYISACCNGKYKQAYGFKWKYKN